VVVKVSEVVGNISPLIYGQMIEHAYWAVHLGLWAQMLDNGGFELDRDGKHLDIAEGWAVASTNPQNRYTCALDAYKPFNAFYSQSIQVAQYVGGQIRLFQRGLHVKKGKAYNGHLYLRGKLRGKVAVSLAAAGIEPLARQELGSVDSKTWKQYSFTLTPNETSADAAFFIEIAGSGTISIDQASLMPAISYNGHGTRSDIMETYKALRPSIVRWPGGSYLMWHDWKRAIGPQDRRYYGFGRQVRGQVGEWDPNLFGTDEYIQFCRDIGAEPMINVNIKNGLQSTLNWIEYCNGGRETTWGARRASNRHPEPYNVRYWVIDNEPLPTPSMKGYLKSQYPEIAAEWARAMKAKDLNIKVFIFGEWSGDSWILAPSTPEFDVEVLKATRDVIDYLCMHWYMDQYKYPPLQGMPLKVEQAFHMIKKAFDEICPNRRVQIALTEWNTQCFSETGGNLAQGLDAAMLLNVLERASAKGIVGMAAPCQLAVNVQRYALNPSDGAYDAGRWLRSALVQIDNHRVCVGPIYLIMRMYREAFAPQMLSVTIQDAPMLTSSIFSDLTFSALDVVATKDVDKGLLILKTVNVDPKNAYDVTIELHDMEQSPNPTVQVFTLTAPSLATTNSLDAPDRLAIQKSRFNGGSRQFRYKFPSKSVTVMAIQLKNN